jgi:3-deoxy-D-manno-octulosonic-acid transferase
MKKSILFVAVAGALFTMSAQANIEPHQKETTVIEGKYFGSQSEELMRLREDFILQENDTKTQSVEGITKKIEDNKGDNREHRLETYQEVLQIFKRSVSISK